MDKPYNKSKIVLLLFALVTIVLSAFKTERGSNKLAPTSVIRLDTVKTDPETGLVIDENLYLVKAQCTVCHSSKLIVANHFTRDGWKQKIRWMQANHNLWDLGETEKPVLDYLEKNYAPKQVVSRREPLKDIKWYELKLK